MADLTIKRNDLTRDAVERKWRFVEMKIKAGFPLYRVLDDIEEAVGLQVNALLKDLSSDEC